MSENITDIGEDKKLAADKQVSKLDRGPRSTKLAHSDYTVGWVCALPKEQTAATAMLDERHPDLAKPLNDLNTYTLGSIGKHYIVIACLPKGQIGPSSAATVATQMVRTFPCIRFGLMVGIGGGIPPKVRLGDVVVSTPVGQFSGVVQWDFGKANEGGNFERTGSLNYPPASLGTALTKLETEHDLEGTKIPEYLDELRQKWPNLSSKYLRSETLIDPLDTPDASHDISRRGQTAFLMVWNIFLTILGYLFGSQLFTATNHTAGQAGNSLNTAVDTEQRKPGEMRVHYGLIASGNQVIKDAAFRDKLNKDLGGHIYCVEMEAAGLMNNFPCIVIRGICDYADAQKNKTWQEYAAVVAAAFAKELLGHVQPSEVYEERTAKDILGPALELLGEIRQEVVSTRVKIEKKEDLDILNWLTPIDYGPQHSDFLKTRQPGTCQWFLNSIEYQNWVSKEKDTLYCPGIPGAGKTILTAVTIEDLTTRFRSNPGIGISYIYCNYRRNQEQRAEDLLANLLKQLCQKRPSLPDTVKGLHDRHKTEGTRPSFDELADTLRLVVAMYSQVFIIVDALDECQVTDGCRVRFLTELIKLQTKTRTNIFATSRTNPEIEVRFKGCHRYNIIASEVDIRAYLHGHMWQLLGFVKQRPDLQNIIEEEITLAAGGMFLLARLYFDSLKDKTSAREIKTLLRKLRNQSQEKSNDDQKFDLLSEAYDQAMERIQGQQNGFRQLAKSALSWILCARRQLTTWELQHALAVSVGDDELDQDNLRDIKDIVSVCIGLVTVDEQSDIIRLVHYTTQEYFERTQKRWFPDVETELATICVVYISFSVFETGVCETKDEFEHRLLSYPLYGYAAHNWGRHARSATRFIPQIRQFLGNGTLVDASNQAFIMANDRWPKISLRTGGTTAVHLASCFGLAEEVTNFLRETKDVDQADQSGRTPLSLAAEHGHEDTVELLLEVGAKIDLKIQKGPTPLIFAAQKGHEAVTKLLLARGATVDIGDNDYQTPLMHASENGHEAIVKLLLARGAEVDIGDKNEQTPLSYASENGHVSIVKLLLAKGAEVNSVAQYYFHSGTPLSFAAQNGHEATVKLLLEQAAEIDWKGIYGRTALSHAAQNGHEATVKLLLAQGADINTKSWNGLTPLSFAAENKHEAVIELLLNNGADINSKYNGGQTLLTWAPLNGHESIVKLLLNMGANFESEDDSGRTGLSWAAGEGQINVVGLLLTIENINVDSKDNFGLTPLMWAALDGHKDIIKLLLDRGAHLESKDSNGRTALSLAAREGHHTIVELLLEVGNMSANSRDNFGRTPLMWASANGHDKIVKTLIQHGGIDPDIKDFYGSTPLSIAARHDRTQVIKCLLDTGRINVTSQDRFGRTSLWYARRYENAQVTHLLLEHMKKNGISASEDDVAVRAGPKPTDTIYRVCDVCTMGIEKKGVCYHCQTCNSGDLDVCLDCYEAGGHCFVADHELMELRDG